MHDILTHKVSLSLFVLLSLRPGITVAQDARQVAREVLPSVVVITTYDAAGRRVGLGSGFFVTESIVATNFHVVDGATRASVKMLGTPTIYDISGVVAISKQRDLILLQVEGVRGKPLTLGRSGQTEVGLEIYACGNPEGLEGTISTGIISGIGTRRIEGEDLIQITAPISPGSSGGPVVNKQGEVIGVAESSLGGGQNLNFAVPSDYLVSLLASTGSLRPLSSVTNPSEPSRRPPQPNDVSVHVTETLVDSSTSDNPAVDKMLDAYSPRVRVLEVVIGNLKGELRKGGTGAGSLGNFVADGMRSQASLKLGKRIDLAIMNGGGIRRNTISPGEVRARDIFELLPFENALVTLELTGEQVTKLLGTVISSHEAQSGARLTYINKADKSAELETAKLLDENRGETEIDPKANYTVVTIDYLVNVGGDRYAVLREGKNTRPLGITLRDAIMNYVKSETVAGRDIKPNLDGRFVLDRTNSAPAGETPPQ